MLTPSHNPLQDGGFKYNPPTGGPAESATTAWIAAEANALLESGLNGVRRVPYEHAQGLTRALHKPCISTDNHRC